MGIKSCQKGSSLVEVLLAAALLGLVVIALTGMLLYGTQSTSLGGLRSRAGFLAEEGLEATRAIRNNAYTNLTNGNHGLGVSSPNWIFSGSSDAVDSFYARQVAISESSLNRKQVTSTITWQQNLQRVGTTVLTSRLTNWLKSVGNWATPIVETSFDLTAGNSGIANTDGRSIAYDGNKIYLGRDNSGGREFYIFDVSNPAAPTMLGQRDLNGDPNDIVIYGNYAYIASTDNSEELQILDISDPATISNTGKLTTVDLTNANSGHNTSDAIALALSESYLIMLRDGGDEFLIFDLSNPAAPGNPVGRNTSFAGSPNDVVVLGNYAYVPSTDNSEELQIFDITTKTSPTRAAVFDLNSGTVGADGLSVAAIDTHILVGRVSSGGAPEVYAISVSTPTSPTLSSTLEIGSDIRAIYYDHATGYAFLATNDNSNDFKVVDASDPTLLPSVFGTLDINNSPLDLIYDFTLNRVFVTSSENTEELQVIKSQ